MTPSQIESVRVLNEKKKGYRLIAQSLFPVPACPDGYTATSKQDELLPILTAPPPGTSTTTTQIPR